MVSDPCNPSPCGTNAICNNGICSCQTDYTGDPYVGCRPECVLNSDCPQNRACVRNKCTDPCPGTCGSNALCNVFNHVPMCSCPPGMTGNAFLMCSPQIGIAEKKVLINDSIRKIFINSFENLINDIVDPILADPCNPSPCGPNSRCRAVNNQAVCTCVTGYIGSPPSCRPECVVSSDCPKDQACSNQRCINPCEGSCGLRAQCQVVNHNPICSCPDGLSGSPFSVCEVIRKRMLFIVLSFINQ